MKQVHSVKVKGTQEYRMPSTWIDTDNECWSEPVAGVPPDTLLKDYHTCIRLNGQAPLFPNP